MTILQLRLIIVLELLFMAAAIHAAIHLQGWDRLPIEEIRAMPHGLHYIGLLEARYGFLNGAQFALGLLAAVLACAEARRMLQSTVALRAHALTALLIPAGFLGWAIMYGPPTS